jgi:glycosyltransferase involved in cell wall biosynthesis
VTTLHGRLDLPDLLPFFLKYPEFPLVSISHDQRRPLPGVKWVRTVHHGLPPDLLRLTLPRDDEGYLAFLGRISPEKRPDRAIEIARRAGKRLKIAAKVDQADREYFEYQIKPLLEDPGVEFIGEIGETDKNDFLGHAQALLFPIDWPEPFGIVMIEAMACGTPVIAFPEGSVPEVLEDGVTGFLVSTIEQAVEAVGRLQDLDRRRIRQRFEQRYTVAHMAKDYLEIYQSLARRSRSRLRVA